MKTPPQKKVKILLILTTILYALFVPLWGEIAIFSWMLLDTGISLPFFFIYLLLFRLPNLIAIPLIITSWYYYSKENNQKCYLFTLITLSIFILFVAYLLFDRFIIPKLILS